MLLVVLDWLKLHQLKVSELYMKSNTVYVGRQTDSNTVPVGRQTDSKQ